MRFQGVISLCILMLFSMPVFAQVDQPEPCKTPGDCVTLKQCTDTLIKELNLEEKWAGRTCNFENDLKEWNIIRRKVILPVAVSLAKDFIAQNLWELSALQLALIDIYYLWPSKLQIFRHCTQQFYEQIELEWMDSHDLCYSIYRNHDDKFREELVACVEKRKVNGETPIDATNNCLDSMPLGR